MGSMKCKPLNEALKDMETIQDFTIDGKCSNCGGCCSNILPMTRRELDRIKKYVKKHGIKDQAYQVLNAYNMVCPFRNENEKKCVIYKIRPSICRDYQCDKQVKGELGIKNIDFSQKYYPILVREEIYGGKDWLKDMIENQIVE